MNGNSPRKGFNDEENDDPLEEVGNLFLFPKKLHSLSK